MKRLVLCCDGTWNRAGQTENRKSISTNVVRLAYHIAKSDGRVPQIIYYDEGVGTGNWWDRITGGAFGQGLEENVHEAYRFLIGNYRLGDEIYLFGFSRGAFTARSIAGLIRKCGILRRDSVKDYRLALSLYRSGQHPASRTMERFRQAHSIAGRRPIKIRFIGVWDTVGSLGTPWSTFSPDSKKAFQFHDTELSWAVERACHALAIDEHRVPFEPSLWFGAGKRKPGQTVRQVWFCGAHSDVGGGYVERELSDIPLTWMLTNAREAGLALDMSPSRVLPIRPSARGVLHRSMTWWYRGLGWVKDLLSLGSNPANEGGKLLRPIGLSKSHPRSMQPPTQPDPTQSIHQSVLDRWDTDETYRPDNLRAYFVHTRNSRAGD